jgi:hypothetical protein
MRPMPSSARERAMVAALARGHARDPGDGHQLRDDAEAVTTWQIIPKTQACNARRSSIRPPSATRSIGSASRGSASTSSRSIRAFR